MMENPSQSLPISSCKHIYELISVKPKGKDTHTAILKCIDCQNLRGISYKNPFNLVKIFEKNFELDISTGTMLFIPPWN